MVGESRTELLQWLNHELGLNYTKVEQCGSGAAYCQLMDLIFGGVPMGKVKFEAKSEYDYRSNMKILQAAFIKHRITKPIEVERLIKCRLQDNLDLLQWFKKFWMENKAVHSNYNAEERRSSSGASAGSRVSSGSYNGAAMATRSRPASRVASGSHSLNTSITNASNSSNNGNYSTKILTKQRDLNSKRVSSAELNSLYAPTTPIRHGSLDYEEKCRQLRVATEELAEYKAQLEIMETERNFYYNKLIDIEQLVRNVLSKEKDVDHLSIIDFSNHVQEILYTTEEGFQVGEDIDAETF